MVENLLWLAAGVGVGLLAMWLVAAFVWLVGAYMANKGGMKRRGGR